MLWEEFKKTVIENSLIKPNDSVLSSVSGGADSVCLFYLLRKLKEEINFTLDVVHFNHGLRGKDALKDVRFVEKLVQKNDGIFHNIEIPVKKKARREKLGIEESARMLRYEQYRCLARAYGYNKIALAHHMDDQAETVLFRIIRGTGLKGLGGIPLVRKLEDTKASIIRPLLNSPKKEILRFLKGNNYSFRTDHTNFLNIFIRNKIRNTIIPLLKKINPGVTNHIAQLSHIVRKEDEYWHDKLKNILRKVVKKRKNQFFLDLCVFNKYHKTIRTRILLHICQNVADFSAINRIINLGEFLSSGKKISIPGGGCAEKSYNTLIITLAQVDHVPQEKQTYSLTVPGRSKIADLGLKVYSRIKERKSSDIRSDSTQAFVNWDALKEKKFYLRFRSDGDRFYPFGSDKKIKIKDFFINQHVPRYERENVPLICAGNEIVWVVGHRTDDRWKITPKTKKILEINIEK